MKTSRKKNKERWKKQPILFYQILKEGAKKKDFKKFLDYCKAKQLKPCKYSSLIQFLNEDR